MTIVHHPKRGTILICDFNGFIKPEMSKRRPVIVISPDFKGRGKLCTVVALSTTEPSPIRPYHFKFPISPPLPYPYNSPFQWIKGDMVYSVSFNRLFLPVIGKDNSGKRIYDIRVVDDELMGIVESCVLAGLGIGN